MYVISLLYHDNLNSKTRNFKKKSHFIIIVVQVINNQSINTEWNEDVLQL